MLDRRQSTRDKVIFGGVAEIGEHGVKRDCVVRNISDNGAHIEFCNVVRLPKEQLSLTIARKGRSFLAKVVWWRDNFVGVAFSSEQPYELPVSDLERAPAQEREEKAPAAAPHQRTARRRLTTNSPEHPSSRRHVRNHSGSAQLHVAACPGLR